MDALGTIVSTVLAGFVVSAGVAVAQTGAPSAATVDGDVTTITVSPPTLIAAPELSPADFGGVRAARRGRPLPKGYVAVGHRVTVNPGRRLAYPAFTIVCPRGKTLRTFAEKPGGSVFPQIVGQSPIVRERAFDYVGKPRWAVIADYRTTGAPASGTIYGLCR